MTTIAYRDGVLAADTLVTENDRVVGYVTKIRSHKGVKWGCSGCLIHQGEFDAWVMGGMNGKPPEMKTPAGATSKAVLIANGFMLTFDDHGYDAMPLPEFFAVGSGAALAMGAMASGVGAVDAVRAAAGFDLFTGGQITVLH